MANVNPPGSNPPHPPNTKPTPPEHTGADVPGADSTDYPKTVFHKDSKAGKLITKVVNSAQEEHALGKEWGDLARLKIETAPAEGTPPPKDEDGDA